MMMYAPVTSESNCITATVASDHTALVQVGKHAILEQRVCYVIIRS